MTVFEELLNLDRPFVGVKLAIGPKSVDAKARRLNAIDQDALDAYTSDEYARLILEYTDLHKPQNELNRVREIYLTRPRKDLMDQILGTRYADIQKRMFELSGLTAEEVQAKAAEMSEEDYKAYDSELRDLLRSCELQAKDEIAADYDDKSDEELATILSQVNVNIRAQAESQSRHRACRLYYVLYDADGNRFFPSVQSVFELSKETIQSWLTAVDVAFLENVTKDLPFALQGGPELSGQPSSQSSSAEDTKAGGKPIKTTRKSSKQSTKPA